MDDKKSAANLSFVHERVTITQTRRRTSVSRRLASFQMERVVFTCDGRQSSPSASMVSEGRAGAIGC